MPGDIERFTAGERPSAGKLTRNFARLAEGSVVSSDGSILITRTPAGTDLRAVQTPTFDRRVVFKLSSDASGGGKYNGKSRTALPTADIAATGTLAESNLGTFSATEDVLALNTREVGASTHDLDAAGFLPLVFVGWLIRTNADGTKVVEFDGLQTEACT